MLMRMVDVSEYAAFGVKVEDGRLFIGTHEVQEPKFIQGDKIGGLYIIRVLRDGRWMFVTGFDLSKGMFWLGPVDVKIQGERESLPSGFYDSMEAVERVLNLFCTDTKGQNWAIFEEGCNTPEEEAEEERQREAMWDDSYELMDFD
jgi:hypothetical protein